MANRERCRCPQFCGRRRQSAVVSQQPAKACTELPHRRKMNRAKRTKLWRQEGAPASKGSDRRVEDSRTPDIVLGKRRVHIGDAIWPQDMEAGVDVAAASWGWD